MHDVLQQQSFWEGPYLQFAVFDETSRLMRANAARTRIGVANMRRIPPEITWERSPLKIYQKFQDYILRGSSAAYCGDLKKKIRYLIIERFKLILACQEVLKWVQPSLHRNMLPFIQIQTLPPSIIHEKWKNHRAYNQLPIQDTLCWYVLSQKTRVKRKSYHWTQEGCSSSLSAMPTEISQKQPLDLLRWWECTTRAAKTCIPITPISWQPSIPQFLDACCLHQQFFSAWAAVGLPNHPVSPSVITGWRFTGEDWGV